MKFVKLIACSTAILLLHCFQLNAQNKVTFEELTFEEAMVKAKKEKKFIFTDVGRGTPSETDIQVEKTVFNVDSVAKFFNTNLICIKINMNSEEGKKFAPRLAMLMYPAYVFYDQDGNQLSYTNAGTVLKSPHVLMEKARVSLKDAITKQANTRSINFDKSNWETLLAKAKKENKLIFLDAHTEWCRPCIMMAKDVFTLNPVADFYNKHFINTEMDMEKGQGPALAKKYKINSYPAFLYINGDGDIVSRDGGYQEADKFIAAGNLALEKHHAATPNSIPFDSPLLKLKAKEQEVGKKATTNGAALIRPAGKQANAMQGAALIKPAGTKQETGNQGAALIRPAGTNQTSSSTTTANTATQAPETAIQFETSSWKEILAEAKRSNKLIFLDAHTSWCGPCKVMKADVFTNKEVGELYNRNFVNAYIDMEKGEGPALQKEYEVRYYPTLLYINGDGAIVHKVVGSCSVEKFLQHGLNALSPTQNLKASKEAYEKDPIKKEHVLDYLSNLGTAYEKKNANTIAIKYLESIAPRTWTSAENWAIIKNNLTDASSHIFATLVANQAEFQQLYGDEVVSKFIYDTYQSWPINYITNKKDAPATLDEAGFNAFISDLRNSDYSKKEEIIAKAHLTVYSALRNWTEYIATVNNMIAEHILSYGKAHVGNFYQYASLVDRYVEKDKTQLLAANNWLENTIRQVPELAPSMKVDLLQIQASILKKLGNKKDLKKVTQQMAVLNAAKQTEGQGVPMMRMMVK